MIELLKLRICHLYPDLMNLYGDRGNILTLTRRCLWRGIEVDTTSVSLGEPLAPGDYDILFMGGGQDYEQSILMEDLLSGKKELIKEAIENGKVFLGICGGLQLLGKYYRTHEGEDIEGIGALNLWTHGSHQRMIGNMVFRCDFLKKNSFDGLVVGFENHSGKTYLGQGVSPLGTVVKGFGNNGEDAFEGAHYNNVFCSYSHGSLLPKNPALADHLITLALKNKYSEFEELAALDDGFEANARTAMLQRLSVEA